MMTTLRRLIPTVTLTALLILPLPCLALKSSQNTVFQLSTAVALLQGVYDGSMTIAQLAKKGNFGLGTFVNLDGEMIALDGTFYYIDAAGKAQKSQHNQELPFALVTRFGAENTFNIEQVSGYTELKTKVIDGIHNPNIPYAIRIKGKFKKQFVRSLKPQLKPYQTMEVAVKEQTEIEIKEVEGDMVGFWFPEYLENVSITGFHFHFIDSERLQGGHVLDVFVTEAKVSIQPLHDLTIGFPENDDFRAPSLNGDHSEAIKRVENQPKV